MPSSNPARFAGVRALIFDLDGTLIDSGRDLALSVNATLEHMGRAPLPEERIFSYVGQGAMRLIEQALGNATQEECERGLTYFLAYYRLHMLDNTVTYPGVREGLAALEGMPMAVLTNKPVRFSQEIIDGLGLERGFFASFMAATALPPRNPIRREWWCYLATWVRRPSRSCWWATRKSTCRPDATQAHGRAA